MRIVFLCGSLEPGRDGVGDYTRSLAIELIQQGHQVGMIALNDKHVTTLQANRRGAEEAEFPVLRIPSVYAAKERFKQAQIFVHTFNPEWLSLQFVPFSFHSKGLPVRLGKQLAVLGKGRKWHIMFHELWVGREPEDNSKRILYSILQKLLINQLIATLHPSCIHTNLPVYTRRLEKSGYPAKNLPLFSNISLMPDRVKKQFTIFRIGIFSQIEANHSVIDFIIKASSYAENENLPLEILLIGGNEARMKNFGSIINNLAEFTGHIRYTNFLEPPELSIALQSCTIGVTSVPRHALGKSGSVTAFLAHGIPVAAPCVFPDYHPQDIGFFSDKLKSAILLSLTNDDVRSAQAKAHSAKDSILPATIATLFAIDLQRVQGI